MKKLKLFCKILALFIVVASLLTQVTACKVTPDTPPDEIPGDTPKKEYFDISEFTIIRREASDARVTDKTIDFKKAIEAELGTKLAIKTDWYAPTDLPDPNAKEILIDKTNRQESEAAFAKLEENENDAYVIEITENKIIIVGKSAVSTTRALTYFINNYILPSEEAGKIDVSSGKTLTKDYDVVKNIYIADKLDMDVEVVSTLLSVNKKGEKTTLLDKTGSVTDVGYPSVIELQHQKNKENNGKLLAIFEFDHACTVGTTGSVWESNDGGETWDIIGRPKEMKDKTLKGITMAHLYELPAQVGDMPAGTILYAGNSVEYSRKSHIAIWRSFDCGYTWEEYVIVATGGGLDEGVWEPFMWYEESDGYLYCFYSDDSDPDHDQKLAYKRSKDGVNWSNVYDVCALDNPKERPGMFSMAKMGNGQYFMVYEYCGSQKCHVYYKITDDITSWNPSDPGKLLKVGNYSMGSAPWCIWTPAGGECGTLIATGMWEVTGGDGKQRMFVSFDYGQTWDLMTNPLDYIVNESYKVGYSPSFALGSDPSVIYYMNTTNASVSDVKRMQFARLKIYDLDLYD